MARYGNGIKIMSKMGSDRKIVSAGFECQRIGLEEH